jgi:hypothetical protein
MPLLYRSRPEASALWQIPFLLGRTKSFLAQAVAFSSCQNAIIRLRPVVLQLTAPLGQRAPSNVGQNQTQGSKPRYPLFCQQRTIDGTMFKSVCADRPISLLNNADRPKLLLVVQWSASVYFKKTSRIWRWRCPHAFAFRSMSGASYPSCSLEDLAKLGPICPRRIILCHC